MREPRGLGARLALTVLPVIALFLASTKLLLPGIGADVIVRRMQEEAPFAAQNLGVFAVGVMPFVSAYFCVELVALVSKRLRRLRHGNPEGRAKLDRAARALGLVFAVVQAFGIATSLRALSAIDSLATTDLPTVSIPLVTATLVGGACIAMLVADLVTRQGIVNGLLLLPCIDLVLRSIGEVKVAHAKAVVADAWQPRHALLIAGAVAIMLITAWAATRGVHDGANANRASSEDRTAYRDARALAVTPWVPVPSSSIAPYTIGASLVMIPATLTNLGLPLGGVEHALAHSDLTFWVVFVALFVALAFVLTRLLHRSSEAEDLARRLGTSIDPTKVIAAQNRALVPTMLFFATIAVATAALSGVPFLRLSIALLPIAATLLIDAAHALRLPAAFTGVWHERRAAAVPVVRAALEARGIETRVTGAATQAMLQAFAPYAPATIHVPAPHAERATKILRHLLLGDDAPEAEPDEPAKRETDAGWTTRTRLVALGLTLLAACGLLGIAAMKSAPPPVRVPPKLELLVVADTTDVLARIPESELPPDIELRSEQVPVGMDEDGRRKTATTHFGSVRLRDGETVEHAILRGEAWSKTLTLPPRMHLGWEPSFDWDPETGKNTPSGARTFLLEGDSQLSNADIVEANAAISSMSGAPEAYVAITLTPEAGERFRKLTATRINQRIAIVLDGRVNSAPVVRDVIGGGRISITMGAGDPEKQLKEAQALARGLSQH